MDSNGLQETIRWCGMVRAGRSDTRDLIGHSPAEACDTVSDRRKFIPQKALMSESGKNYIIRRRMDR